MMNAVDLDALITETVLELYKKDAYLYDLKHIPGSAIFTLCIKVQDPENPSKDDMFKYYELRDYLVRQFTPCAPWTHFCVMPKFVDTMISLGSLADGLLSAFNTKA